MKRFAILFVLIGTTASMAQTPVATVPFELFGEHLFIKLTLNNSSEELDFIFDTGDGLSVLDIETAERLNIRSNKKIKETSAGGRVTGYLVKHNAIHLNDVEIDDVKLYETSLNHLETAIGRNIDGIIGYDLLQNFVVEVDYNAMEFHIYNFNNYQYSGTGKSLDINLKHAIPYVPGVVTLGNGDVLKGNFYLETGARTDLDFNTPFVNDNNLKSKVGDTYSYLVTGLSDHESVHTRGKVDQFDVAGFTFTDLPVGLSQESVGIQADGEMAGIIGNEILHRFNVVYNYKARKMWWTKNTKYEGTFFINSSGILLQMDKSLSKILIHQVFPGSPAYEAGLMVDDEIVEINGMNAAELTLPKVRELLAESETLAKLSIKSKGSLREVEIRLKKLIN